MPAAYVDENIFIRYEKDRNVAIQSWHADEIREMAQQCSTISELSRKLGLTSRGGRGSGRLKTFLNKHQIVFGVRRNCLAYQDESGKWYKQCSTTKQLFGPVDSLEELGEWFRKDKHKKDGFCYICKKIDKQYRQENTDKAKQYRQENKDKLQQYRKQRYEENKDEIKQYSRQYWKSAAGLLSHYKKSAKRRGINCTLKEEWFEEQMKLPQFNICAVSGKTFVVVDEPNHPHSRTLDRISSTKGYTPDNVRWVCRVYNTWKSDLTLKEMFEIAKYMCEHHNLDPVKYMESIVYGKDNPHLAAK